MLGSNPQPRDQESHGSPTEPVRCPFNCILSPTEQSRKGESAYNDLVVAIIWIPHPSKASGAFHLIFPLLVTYFLLTVTWFMPSLLWVCYYLFSEALPVHLWKCNCKCRIDSAFSPSSNPNLDSLPYFFHNHYHLT